MNWLSIPVKLGTAPLVVLLPFAAWAQTLSLSSGVQRFGALTNATVTMTGRCELWVTNATAPLTGCTIHLNSADAFVVLPGIKPSAVASTYLSQVRVNGSAAVADSNCRVVQYAMGAIVVPQAPTFRPMQVFAGPHFAGATSNLSQYVYYNTAASLGHFDANIGSFKLKRGYTATLAENANGSGHSRNYVAADGDMEVSLLPGSLDQNVRFIYVTPWRWTSKKAVSGNPGISQLNVQSWYNWNISEDSTRDLEYVPIRQTRWWPSLSQNWQTRGANHLLGFNEPDRPDQANMSVGDAISSWPGLLATGLRVGSPATSDGGFNSWLFPFMDQANAADLRVDFVAVHYYRCRNPTDPNGAAGQLYDALKGIYDQTKRPLWVTEWNNGANWTSCGDPTYSQQQAAIAAMIDMLDNTPFVERYMLYNWVEDVRALTTNGVLTPAGVSYRDNQSPVGYVQALQDNGTRSFAQLRFETNTLDTSGYGNNAIGAGSPGYTNGVRGSALVFDGANTILTLPPNVARNNGFTFGAWIKWNGGANWQRIFDFGNSTTHYMFLTPNAGSSMRFAIANGGGEQRVDAPVLPIGSWQHVTFTLSGSNARLYLNGSLVASNTSMTISPANFDPRVNRLGKSQFIADPLFSGLMDEVLLTDYALSAADIARLPGNNPPQFTNNQLLRGSATDGFPYADTIAGSATDPDPGDTFVYSKTTGPAWLNVAADGSLTGTPASADSGTNYFTVRATDVAGQNAFALLSIHVIVPSASSAWIADASAAWSDITRWRSNVVATGAGQTADFSITDITADRTVTLDTSRTVGALRFSDSIDSQSWTLAATAGRTLTLSSGSTAQPSIVVSNTVTIAAPLAGTNGFTKSGPGTLVLTGDNTFGGTAVITAGALVVHGTNAAPVDARFGTQLAGTGSLGPVTIRQAAELSPGPQPNARLTTEDLTLDGASMLTIDLDLFGDQVVVNGDVILNGRLNIRASASVVNRAYTIIRYTGTRSGNGLLLTNVPPGYSMVIDYGVPGEVRLLVAGGLDPSPILPAASHWKYNTATNLPPDWHSLSFDDTAWPSGPAQIGYGDNDEGTAIDITGGRPQVIYFRKTFTLSTAGIGAMSNSILSLLRDDGAVVYLNGMEIRRDNMPPAPEIIGPGTPALVTVSNEEEDTYFESALAPGLFVEGTNVVAVEVHQDDPGSSDISFDLKLEALIQGPKDGQLLPVAIVTAGASWKYHDQANDPGSAWRSNTFNDGTWSSGPSMLGFGDANGITPATVVASNRQWTTYFRREFQVPDASQVRALTARILRDDAAVVYLNGVEIWRDTNITSGPIGYNTPADIGLGGSDESTWLAFSREPGALKQGTNLIAIEVHQNALSSSDLAMNFELSAILLLPRDVRLSIAGDSVSWPGWFSLYTTTNLSPPSVWTRITNGAVFSTDRWQMTFPTTNGQRYFRVRSP